jgi:DNA-binding GntR family transcriptional regulator
MKPENSVHKKGVATQEAFRRIKELIASNQLVPGQRLIYNDLAKRINMGVTPVIQALNRLEASNLVTYEPNRGYFVGEVTEGEIRELYQAREALEVAVLPAVAENIDASKINRIRQDFIQSMDSRRSRRELILDDIRFHLAIVKHSHNTVIYNLLKDILEQVYLKYRPEYLDDERVKVIVHEHRALLQSLKKGDVEEATRLLREHIRSGMEYVIGTIQFEIPEFYQTM